MTLPELVASAPPMSAHTYFVSDLHVFSRRSQATRYHDQLHATAREAQTFVLGGDIFDFRWSTLKSVDATVNAAIAWLEELVVPHAQCQFHFVLGNHDCNKRFVQRLDTLAARLPNLEWHDAYLRLGHSLFLHGDVADANMNSAMLTMRRQKWHHDHCCGPVKNMLYDLAVNARLHKLAGQLANPQAQVAARITSYLEDVGQSPKNGLRHVYFGHTHIALSHFQFGGMLFHNGGAPIKGLDFRIIKTEATSAT